MGNTNTDENFKKLHYLKNVDHSSQSKMDRMVSSTIFPSVLLNSFYPLASNKAIQSKKMRPHYRHGKILNATREKFKKYLELFFF